MATNPNMPEKRFKDKNILLTGANGLFGKELAKQFAIHGANLILLGRNVPALNKTAAHLHHKHSINCFTYKLDMLLESSLIYKKLILYLEKNIPHLDAVILNTDPSRDASSLLNYPFRMWKNNMQIHLDANMMLSQSLLPLLMKASTPLLIFNLAEEKADPLPLLSAYAVAKAGLKRLMQVISEEFANSHLMSLGVELNLKSAEFSGDAAQLKRLEEAAQNSAALYLQRILNIRDSSRGKIVRLEESA